MPTSIPKKVYKDMVKEINILHRGRIHLNNNVHQKHVIINLFFYVYQI